MLIALLKLLVDWYREQKRFIAWYIFDLLPPEPPIPPEKKKPIIFNDIDILLHMNRMGSVLDDFFLHQKHDIHLKEMTYILEDDGDSKTPRRKYVIFDTPMYIIVKNLGEFA